MRYDGVVTDFVPGDVIGRRYRLIEQLGAGAMGVVWSARNEAIDRRFAIKLMRAGATANASRLQRFFREAKAAGRLRHRTIIEVYDLGRVEQLAGEPLDPHVGTPYLVMELLEGAPLDAVIEQVGKLPPATALRIVEIVARGLHVAHQGGIIHRDLKPANLFLHRETADGAEVDVSGGGPWWRELGAGIMPKVLDFGVSKLLDKIDSSETTEGTVLGSPAYMSPEQTWGEVDLDGRADVWSLGVVLYKALSGEQPFRANNFHGIMMAINNTAELPLTTRVPGMSPAVSALVHKCLEKERDQRFLSALALADAIEELLSTHELETIDLRPTLRIPRRTEGSVRTAHPAATAKIGSITDPTLVAPFDPRNHRPSGPLAAALPTSASGSMQAAVDATFASATVTLGGAEPSAFPEDRAAASTTGPRPALARRRLPIVAWVSLAAVAGASVFFAARAMTKSPSGSTPSTTAPAAMGGNSANVAATTSSATPSSKPQGESIDPPIVSASAASSSAKPPKLSIKPLIGKPLPGVKKPKPGEPPAHEGVKNVDF